MSDPAPTLTYRKVWALYFPLALSWLFMGLEGPIAVKVISLVGQGRPIEEVWTAAFNALLAIALFVESPVIDLLATSTTLTKGARSYRIISRFALLMMALCTAAHLFVLIPPVYNWIARDYTPAVRAELWLPLLIMLPWSPAIGWRRYKQGILIRFGETRVVSVGTFIRVSMMAMTGFGLAYFSSLSGIMITACSLIASVVSEAIYIHFAARGAIARHLGEEDEGAWDTKRLAGFHLPLTVTTMMQLGTNLMITQALAQAIDRGTSWPAYQVALTLMWLQRAVLYALPEIVITLHGRPGADRLLWRFSATVAASMSGLMMLLAFTGLDRLFFIHVLGKSPVIAEASHQVFLLSSLIPLIIGAQCYVRGVLTALHETRPRMRAVFFGLITMAGIMWLGLNQDWPGAWIGAAAPTAGALVELAILADAMRRARTRALNASPGRF